MTGDDDQDERRQSDKVDNDRYAKRQRPMNNDLMVRNGRMDEVRMNEGPKRYGQRRTAEPTDRQQPRLAGGRRPAKKQTETAIKTRQIEKMVVATYQRPRSNWSGRTTSRTVG